MLFTSAMGVTLAWEQSDSSSDRSRHDGLSSHCWWRLMHSPLLHCQKKIEIGNSIVSYHLNLTNSLFSCKAFIGVHPTDLSMMVYYQIDDSGW